MVCTRTPEHFIHSRHFRKESIYHSNKLCYLILQPLYSRQGEIARSKLTDNKGKVTTCERGDQKTQKDNTRILNHKNVKSISLNVSVSQLVANKIGKLIMNWKKLLQGLIKTVFLVFIDYSSFWKTSKNNRFSLQKHAREKNPTKSSV